MNYADGTEVRLNDVVDHALCRGEVVVTCDSHGTSVYHSG
ncbi:MAG: hypothetical protein JWO94_2171, partial [Verrucomicrobiaceae bacterium]|nr:hypothetical protein [Verrucomicrobiaceae bacterium]